MISSLRKSFKRQVSTWVGQKNGSVLGQVGGGDGGGGGGFFLACEDFGRLFDYSFPTSCPLFKKWKLARAY